MLEPFQRPQITTYNNPPTFQYFSFNNQDTTCAHSSGGFFKSKSTGLYSPLYIELHALPRKSDEND